MSLLYSKIEDREPFEARTWHEWCPCCDHEIVRDRDTWECPECRCDLEEEHAKIIAEGCR